MSYKPNIVFIMTDMHLRSALGYYGNDVIKTPNIDSIAKAGICGDRAYAQSPVCMPSRTSFMTGRYVKNHGVHRNMKGLAENPETVMQLLSDGGYTTAAVGKMHFMPKAGPFGNKYLDLVTGRRCTNHDYEDEYAVYLRSRGKEKLTYLADGVRPFEPHCSRLPAEEHIEQYIGGAAVEFIKQTEENEPFFLWVGFAGPHHPLDPPAPYDKIYDPEDMPIPDADDEDIARKRQTHTFWPEAPDKETMQKAMAGYYGTISFIDFQVGRILETLKEKGLSDNTYVVFTSDHGMEFGHHGTLIHSFCSLYDESMQIPLVASGPGIPENSKTSAGVAGIDFPATFLEMAGLPAGKQMDGESRLAALQGKDSEGRKVIYSENCWLEEDLCMADGTLVYGDEHRIMRLEYPWKYIHSTDETHRELFNLDDDPEEKNNLVNTPQHQDRIESYKQDISEWLTQGVQSQAGAVDPVEDFVAYDASASVLEGAAAGDVHYVKAAERQDLPHE